MGKRTLAKKVEVAVAFLPKRELEKAGAEENRESFPRIYSIHSLSHSISVGPLARSPRKRLGLRLLRWEFWEKRPLCVSPGR